MREHRRAVPAGAGRDGARAAGRGAARAGRRGREAGADGGRPVREGRPGTSSTSRAAPLDAGCSYEQWFDRIAAGKPTTAYAHIVTEQGELALQYWFYYPFNDWNNKHESDWEMIQLVFDAATAEQALGQTPALVGYSQHEGAESATWDDEKLEKRDGHPVVYPGAGSHANQFVQSLYLGHSAQTGFGCDDTRGPDAATSRRRSSCVPSEASGADDPFAWLGYLGRWGQKVSGPNSGPTGPTFKGQWTKPITLGRRGVAVRQRPGPGLELGRADGDRVLLHRRREGVGDLPPLPAQPVLRARDPGGDRAVRRLAFAPDELVARPARSDPTAARGRRDLPRGVPRVPQPARRSSSGSG